ncbi:phosphonate metabolism protein PhnP [Alginatibacterium sediminis]|uniref:Phosphonate metabolism protein PhnP n=1 Tax=Alginatibacterium sediminis TaxID=2164068 RepID=A0A420EL92_9ALTE|nr:phosphonate metabolism protein PhnP [Alginatibacterium sediminis]RKF21439.1 phosphonate metabolism protein PhnP [Alginatibacterium sediminis]
MFSLTLLGTGSVHAPPVYGCSCAACQHALNYTSASRAPCSALLRTGKDTILIDAGHPKLQQIFEPGSISAILITHYHMDHVQELFKLRWAITDPIDVYHPNDPRGCDDLFKNPGILKFKSPNTNGTTFHLSKIKVTPIALNHSKQSNGYVFQSTALTIAYLTDTKGLPQQSIEVLQRLNPQYIVIDCSFPAHIDNDNHNNLDDLIRLAKILPGSMWVASHIGHELDCVRLSGALKLPKNIMFGYDGLSLPILPSSESTK